MRILSILGLPSPQMVERRSASRQSGIGSVAILGKTYTLVNWSATGLLLSGHQSDLKCGEIHEFGLQVHHEIHPVSITAKALVVRVQRDKLALQFRALTQAQRTEILGHFSRLTGVACDDTEIAAIEDTRPHWNA